MKRAIRKVTIADGEKDYGYIKGKFGYTVYKRVGGTGATWRAVGTCGMAQMKNCIEWDKERRGN
jgi:hypothetical protein